MSAPHGWLIIDKPEGITSAKAVAIVKRLTKAKKVGHAGTLDPLATGVLPIALGEATKTTSFAMEGEKAYQFTIQFGCETTTDDAEGEKAVINNNFPSEAALEVILPDFIGTITQVPPIYSAIKRQGKRLCDRARAGEEDIVPESREIQVNSLKIVEYNKELAQVICEVYCQKGTYVRSLGRDIARKCGAAGHISQLRRIKVGKFEQKDAISLDKLEKIMHNAQQIENLLPVVTPLDDIPVVTLTEDEARKLRHGQTISCHIEQYSTQVKAMLGQELIALATVRNNTIKPARVFNN